MAGNGEEQEKIKASTLSSAAIFALYYAMAVVTPEALAPRRKDGSVETYRQLYQRLKGQSEWRARKEGLHVLTDREYKQALAQGLGELAERGIIGLARDAEGGHEPAQVFLDRVEWDASILISGDGM